jgi:hypothetical protein
VFTKFSGGHDFLLWKENEDDSWQQRRWLRRTLKMQAWYVKAVEDCEVLWARLQAEKKQYAWLKSSTSTCAQGTSDREPTKMYRTLYQITETSPWFKDRVGGKVLFHYEGSPNDEVSLNFMKM